MRLRPQRVFAAAVVTVTGCGAFDAPIDAAAPPDEEYVDCIEDPDNYDCNPPPPWTPDAAPPACVESGGICLECTPSPPRTPSDSLCAASVCAIDSTCCTAVWDERCIDLADARCLGVRCADTIGVGGLESVAWATWTGADFTFATHTDYGEGHWFSVAWKWWRFAGVHANANAPGGPVTGRRLRWAPDVVWSGGHSATGFGLSIVPWADGYIGDFVVADLEGDGDLDVIVAFLDGHGLRLYRRALTWFEPDLESVGPDAHTLELCDVNGDRARDLLLVEADRLDAYVLADGLGPSIFPAVSGAFAEAACADLDGDGRDEIVATQNPGPVVIIDSAGQIVWTAPESLPGAGVDTGDLDGDGDVDLVISEDGPDAHVQIYWNRGEVTLAFDHLEGPILGDDLGRLDLTYLGDALPM